MVAAGPALAQEVIRIGASVSGTLDDLDATGPDGEYRYDDYRLTVRAGQRLEATMQSEAFDTYLAVDDADAGAAAEELYGDDDSFGQNTDFAPAVHRHAGRRRSVAGADLVRAGGR